MTHSTNFEIICNECSRKIVYLKDESLKNKFGETVKFSKIHTDHIVLITIKENQTFQNIFLFKNSVNQEFTSRINSMISGLRERHWKNIVIVSTYELHQTTFLDQIADTIEDNDSDITITKRGNYMKFKDHNIDYTFFRTFEIDEDLIGDPDISYIDFLENEDNIPIQNMRNLSILITESQMTVMYCRTKNQQELILKWLKDELRLKPSDYEGTEDGENYSVLINKPLSMR